MLKYTDQEALSEILKRSEKIIYKRERNARLILSSASGVLLLAIVLIIALLPGKMAEPAKDSVYGSFLLNAQAGGYVLAAVIAFALGITVALFCLKYRRKTNKKEVKRDEEL